MPSGRRSTMCVPSADSRSRLKLTPCRRPPAPQYYQYHNVSGTDYSVENRKITKMNSYLGGERVTSYSRPQASAVELILPLCHPFRRLSAVHLCECPFHSFPVDRLILTGCGFFLRLSRQTIRPPMSAPATPSRLTVSNTKLQASKATRTRATVRPGRGTRPRAPLA